MSHASATRVARSVHITEAAPARPLLVVEHLDHKVSSTVLFCLCTGPSPAPPNAAAFTLCAGPPPANLVPATAPLAVEGDAVAGAWI
ncbi:hypothetical protein O1Q96_22600 [Streptomyces sp. Qhu-G9]|uniref:hypothetical protein n=1 Tax=Streptomyces sp. Qhu-G9 TaxID=3452799 RepID=UPI0022AC1402|nr:hypothetical protein [Streptomyces aurantiacus]WAU82301.1 hypothetical protein O1Q96_22600 [Streptomyces aurantiacus]